MSNVFLFFYYALLMTFGIFALKVHTYVDSFCQSFSHSSSILEDD